MRAHRAFTLVEIMIVVTLLMVAIGVSTLSLAGSSNQARLEAAASQIGSMFRLAVVQASASGRPRLLQLDRTGCSLGKPLYTDGRWVWLTSPRTKWVGNASVDKVELRGGSLNEPSTEPPWRVLIRPGTLNPGLRLGLSLANGVEAGVTIDGRSGHATVRTGTDEH